MPGRVVSACRLLAVAGLLASAVLAVPGATGAIPVPEHDPFYAVPAGIGSLADGTILASRAVAVNAYSVPLPVRAWQVKYKSLDTQGQPTADVTTVLVPRTAWHGAGPRPLVSYQTAEDGAAGKCAPSYALRAGLTAGPTNAEAETGLIFTALAQGWAVTVPDYEGPDSAFLGGPGEAHGVLDGLRATLHFAPAGVAPSAPIGIWGYSGGSFATAVAAQLQPAYAPELRLSGIALGGLVADIAATIDDFDGSAFGGAIAMGIAAFERAYPQADLGQYLNARGSADVAAASGDCIADAAARFPFLRVADIEAAPGMLQLPAVAQLLRDAGPDGIAGVPSAPVYDYHAVHDELAPVGPDRTQMARYCAAGVVVQHVENLVTEHLSETVAGAPGALAFFRARFAGAAPVDTCG